MPTQVMDSEQHLSAITKHVFIVLLQVSWPKLAYQIADAIVEIEIDGKKASDDKKKQEIAERFRTNPQWQLMPESWRKKLGNLESRARTAVNSASVQFAARGMAVVPVLRAAEVFRNLRTLRTEMQQYRDEFVGEYEKILENLKAELGDELYARAAKKLPDADAVKNKFAIVWAIVPTGGRSNVSPQQFDLLERAINTGISLATSKKQTPPAVLIEALAALQGIRGSREVQQLTDEEATELISEAHEQMNRFTQEMVEEMSREPREMLMAAADNLIEALNDPSRAVRTGTIEQVKRAFSMVEGFSFLAGPELLERISGIRTRLNNVTPQVLNSDPELGARLAQGLRGIRDAAADASEAATAMRNFRGIRIREKQETEQPA